MACLSRMIRGKTLSMAFVGSEPQVRRSWDAETEAEHVSGVGMWVKKIQGLEKSEHDEDFSLEM